MGVAFPEARDEGGGGVGLERGDDAGEPVGFAVTFGQHHGATDGAGALVPARAIEAVFGGF